MAAILAGNITDETQDLINEVLLDEKFVRFTLQNKINLHDNTMLVRIALINLIKHLPSNDEVASYKAALLRPGEFDDFLKERIQKEIKN